MFIAIISAHYFEYQREASSASSGGQEEGIVELIISIIRNKMKKKSETNEDGSPKVPDDLPKDKKSKPKGGVAGVFASLK
jgi:hypothetical protein